MIEGDTVKVYYAETGCLPGRADSDGGSFNGW